MANGIFGGGAGTAANPYLIEDANDLDAMRNKVAACYKLVNNINMDVVPFNTEGWKPIVGFSGKLDGNGKKILHLYINCPDSDNVGLFGSFANIPRNYHGGLKVWDLGLENVNIIGRLHVGGLLGRVDMTGLTIIDTPDTIIARVSVAGRVEGSNHIGGLIGAVVWPNNSGGNNNTGVVWTIICDSIVKCNISHRGTADPKNIAGVIGFAQRNYIYYSYNYTAYCALKNVISLCTFSALNNAKIAHSHMSGGDYPAWGWPASTIVNCYYDSKLLNGNIAEACVAMNTQEFYEYSAKLNPLRTVTNDNRPVWRFKVMRYPELWFSNQDCYFVRVGKDYLTYDEKSKKWTKQFDALPSMPEIFSKGMADISAFDIRVWDQLKPFGSIEIINFVENIEKLPASSILRKDIGLASDVQHTDPNALHFRSEKIEFDMCNDYIIKLNPNV